MVDERIKKVAKILVDYSLDVQKDEKVMIRFNHEANPLALEIYKRILKKDAFPIVRPSLSGYSYAYYKNAKKHHLKHYPKLFEHTAKNIDAYVNLGGKDNTRELSNIDPKKISMKSKTTKPISDIIHKKKWALFEYPTRALAQESEMSLKEFGDFVYSASIKDWEKKSKELHKIKEIVDEAEQVRIVGEGTDISFSVKGRVGSASAGHHNLPDGEVFTSPVEDSTEGKIKFSFPGVRYGTAVEGISLEFKKGKVVKAEAEKNEKFLKKMLKTDKNAKRLGEWGIGLNYDIQDFVRNILFDEKQGGSTHLALGNSFEECKGNNPSAIHWDMIKDLRKDGAIIVDGKTFMKKGKVKLDNF